MDLVGYRHEQTSPCDFEKLVFHINRKPLPSPLSATLGLSTHIAAIPCTSGYLLYTDSLVLYATEISTLSGIDGGTPAAALATREDILADLEQLYYYGLICFDANPGSLTVRKVPDRFHAMYKPLEDYVIFPTIPMSVEIDVTSACSFRCIHCLKDETLNRKGEDDHDLPPEAIQSILEDCAITGVPEVVLMGGEPLAHPAFTRLLAFAKQKGIRTIRTSTNGWNVTLEMAKEISRFMTNIQVSVHAADAEVHDAIVGRQGAFKRAVNAIRAFKSNGLKVNVSFSVLPQNRGQIALMPEKAMEWGADALRYLCLIRQGRGSMLQAWDDEAKDGIGKEIKGLYDRYDAEIEIDAGGFPSLRPGHDDACFYGCAAGRSIMYMSSRGAYNCCGSLAGYISRVDNRSILDLWHSPPLTGLRKVQDCDCSFRSVCYGPCLVKEA